jgi:hypothetical protein
MLQKILDFLFRRLPEILYRKRPDWKRADYEQRDLWRVFAVSVRGSAHERRAMPCQDANKYERLFHEVLIIAVADGAGSARYAQKGSQCAVQIFLEFLRSQPLSSLVTAGVDEWRALATRAFQAVQNALVEQAKLTDSTIADFATTLIGVAVTPRAVVTAQIGDGAVVLEDMHGQLHLLSHMRFGEYLNETVFLTSKNALQHARFERWEGEVAHLAIFTDGLELLALQLPDAKPHPRFFQPLFRFVDSDEATVEQLEAFLRSERVRTRTDDDLTLVLVGRVGDGSCA